MFPRNFKETERPSYEILRVYTTNFVISLRRTIASRAKHSANTRWRFSLPNFLLETRLARVRVLFMVSINVGWFIRRFRVHGNDHVTGWELVQLETLISSVKCHCTSLIRPSHFPSKSLFSPVKPVHRFSLLFLPAPYLFVSIRSTLYSPSFSQWTPTDTYASFLPLPIYSYFFSALSFLFHLFLCIVRSLLVVSSVTVSAVSRGKNVYDDARCPSLALTHRRFSAPRFGFRSKKSVRRLHIHPRS